MSGSDPGRLWQRLMELGTISDPGPGVTRRSFSDTFLAGRTWLWERFAAAGLEVRLDHAGNLHGRLPGRHDATVLVGGHSDSVPHGGRFDGALGVLSGLEIAETLRAQGEVPEYALEVVDFLAEEPSEYGLSCVGSRGFAGALTGADLERPGPGGERLGDAIRRVGGNPDVLAPVEPERALRCFLELHIEQGPVLERQPGSLGIVTDIAGIVRYRFRVMGQASHGGTTPMPERRDALVAAGRVAANVYEAASAIPGMVATVGRFNVSPNAVNVVPGLVEAVAEFRSASPQDLYGRSREVMAAALPREGALGCGYDFAEYMRTEPVAMSAHLQDALEAAAVQTGARPHRIFSGAGHDAVEISRRTDVGMLFCPSRDGLSHCPEEWTEPADIARALLAYDRAVRELIGAGGIRGES